MSLFSSSASAVSNFTETFATDDSDWLDGASGTPDYFPEYISYAPAPFNSGAGGFGDPLQILFRGNAGNNASGGAFVGDWLADQVTSLSVDVRHNYTTDLNLYARFNRGFGQAASLANITDFAIAPNTWTTIEIPITDSNPPFVSYGAGNFNSVFTGIQDIQVGLYLPANTDFDTLRFDLDNVQLTVVPEPSTLVMFGLGLSALGDVSFQMQCRRQHQHVKNVAPANLLSPQQGILPHDMLTLQPPFRGKAATAG
ncbi:unnamed protein product [Cladocopium goreaui]|uniref:PEP-CTERM sorting domain-containing protein n=1 Tax=Cladocopium goreaui TaxID=2562237 RepID=A0A9P1FCT4_9DINO|nr:unnamed protein product [Cladocopium goreaui]